MGEEAGEKVGEMGEWVGGETDEWVGEWCGFSSTSIFVEL